jgi:hypothetical protein
MNFRNLVLAAGRVLAGHDADKAKFEEAQKFVNTGTSSSATISRNLAEVAVDEQAFCKSGGGGQFLPFSWWKEEELAMTLEERIPIYLFVLFWMFIGMSIFADIFMVAIETITAEKRTTRNNKTGEMMTIRIWNASVANLSLMAMGSSSPEILLSLIDLIVSNKFYSGDLGPGTLIGSAAFNFYVISGACIMAVSEVKKIKEFGVFTLTASFSFVAYIWLYLIINGSWSKDQIEVWEAAVTFSLFFVLLYAALVLDRRSNRKPEEGELSKDELATMIMQIKALHGEALSFDQIIAKVQESGGGTVKVNSRAAYRAKVGR